MQFDTKFLELPNSGPEMEELRLIAENGGRMARENLSFAPALQKSGFIEDAGMDALWRACVRITVAGQAKLSPPVSDFAMDPGDEIMKALRKLAKTTSFVGTNIHSAGTPPNSAPAQGSVVSTTVKKNMSTGKGVLVPLFKGLDFYLRDANSRTAVFGFVTRVDKTLGIVHFDSPSAAASLSEPLPLFVRHYKWAGWTPETMLPRCPTCNNDSNRRNTCSNPDCEKTGLLVTSPLTVV